MGSTRKAITFLSSSAELILMKEMIHGKLVSPFFSLKISSPSTFSNHLLCEFECVFFFPDSFDLVVIFLI